MSHLNHNIGHKYKYQNSKNVFVLKEVRICTFHFECGHWCTDNVFIDLYDLTKKILVSKDKQLKLF